MFTLFIKALINWHSDSVNSQYLLELQKEIQTQVKKQLQFNFEQKNSVINFCGTIMWFTGASHDAPVHHVMALDPDCTRTSLIQKFSYENWWKLNQDKQLSLEFKSDGPVWEKSEKAKSAKDWSLFKVISAQVMSN